MRSWHNQYRGKSIGRILHFVYHYCGFNVMEDCTVGEDSVHYFGKKIATFKWLQAYDDIPVFEFIDGSAERFLVSAWRENQKEKFFEAVSDCEPKKPEPCRECQSLKVQLNILKGV